MYMFPENPTGMLLAEVKVDIEKMMISNNIELTQQTELNL